MSAITPIRPYEPKDSVTLGFSAAGTSAIVGTVVSAAQNTLAKHRYGALGILTRSGSTIALFTTMGGMYAFGDAAASNLRESNDGWNQFYGGVAAGACAGLYKRTIPAVAGYSIGLGVIMGMFSWAGGNIGGIYTHMSPSEQRAWNEKFFKVQQRRPRSEVLAELTDAPRIHSPAE